MPYLTREEEGLLTQGIDKAQTPLLSGIGWSIGSTIGGIAVDAWKIVDIIGDIEQLKPNVGQYTGYYAWLADILRTTPIDSIGSNIKDVTRSMYIHVINMLERGIGEGVGGLHAQLIEGLSGLGQLQTSFNGMLQRVAIDPYVERWANNTFRPNIPDYKTCYQLRRLGLMTAQSMHDIHGKLGWSEDLWGPLEALHEQPVPLNMIVENLRRGNITQTYANLLLQRYFLVSNGEQMITNMAQGIEEPYRVAEQYTKRVIDSATALKLFQKSGFNSNEYQKWADMTYTRPPFSMLADLRWRGVLTDADVDEQLQKTGYPIGWEPKLRELFNEIPSTQDILRMVAKRAFNSSQSVQAPTDFRNWIAKKGFSNDWADKYWTAHFSAMPLNMAFDMFRRGYWNTLQLKDLLDYTEIRPAYQDDMIKLAYRPPSLRELGFGWDIGVYSTADVQMYRQWSGLAPDVAVKATQALVEYRLEPERRALRTNYMNQFIEGTITEAQFRAHLVTLHTNPQAIELWVEKAQTEITLKSTQVPVYETRTMTRADAEWLYENGVRDATWFTTQLKDLGYMPSAIIDFKAKADAKIAKAKQPTATKTVKELSLAEIRELYHAKLMDKTTALARMATMNYTPADSNLIIEIWDKTKPAKVKELTLSEQIKLFDEQVLTAEQLKARIINMGYIDADATDIVTIAEKTVKKGKAAPQLPEAELEKLYHYGYYDAAGLIAEFVRRGFSQTDALLKTYTITLAIEIPELREQYRNAWIDAPTLAQDLTTLIEPFNTLGNTQDIINGIMETIVKNTSATRVAPQRELTKAEIIKGAKNGVLTPAQAVELLSAIGYTTDEATYLLAINKIVVAGDPQGYWDMRQVVELHRKAVGLDSTPIPDELVVLESQQKEARRGINTMKGVAEKESELNTLLQKQADIDAQIATIVSKKSIKRR